MTVQDLHLRPLARERGFTLVELLVVMSIIVLLVSLIGPVVATIRSSRGIASGSFDIMSALEQARTYAIANNSYVYVGFFEEDATASTFPRAAGVGRVVVSVVASRDGSQISPATGSAPARLDANGGALVPLTKLLKLDGLHLDRLPDGALTKPSVVDQYQVGAAVFGGNTTFTYPPAATGTGIQYSFQKIIQFSPQGDSTRFADTPTRLMEIGLRGTHGTIPDMNSPNVIAIQVTGIASQLKIYRK